MPLVLSYYFVKEKAFFLTFFTFIEILSFQIYFYFQNLIIKSNTFAEGVDKPVSVKVSAVVSDVLVPFRLESGTSNGTIATRDFKMATDLTCIYVQLSVLKAFL